MKSHNLKFLVVLYCVLEHEIDIAIIDIIKFLTQENNYLKFWTEIIKLSYGVTFQTNNTKRAIIEAIGGMRMIDIQSYDQYDELLNNQEYFILYTTAPGCSVCHADYPRVNQLAKEHQFPVYHVDISRIPMLTGQLNLFSSPTVLIYLKGKEYHRQVRIIDFEELAYRLAEIKEHY